MSSSFSVLAVIPARGGSKAVPRKNLRLLGGRPLIQWSIQIALEAPSVTCAVVSTEDAETAQVARSCGLPIPFLRPVELARDDVPTLPVVQHALQEMEKSKGRVYDSMLLLEPTSPFRSVEDVEAACQKLLDTDCDSVVSLVSASHCHPVQAKQLDGDKVLPFVLDEPEGIRRQDLAPPAYVRNGAIYLTRRETLMNGSLYGADVRALIMPFERSINIDTEFDLRIAELMLKRPRK